MSFSKNLIDITVKNDSDVKIYVQLPDQSFISSVCITSYVKLKVPDGYALKVYQQGSKSNPDHVESGNLVLVPIASTKVEANKQTKLGYVVQKGVCEKECFTITPSTYLECKVTPLENIVLRFTSSFPNGDELKNYDILHVRVTDKGIVTFQNKPDTEPIKTDLQKQFDQLAFSVYPDKTTQESIEISSSHFIFIAPDPCAVCYKIRNLIVDDDLLQFITTFLFGFFVAKDYIQLSGAVVMANASEFLATAPNFV